MPIKKLKSVQLRALEADASLFTDAGFDNLRENEAFLKEAIQINEDVLQYIEGVVRERFSLGTISKVKPIYNKKI